MNRTVKLALIGAAGQVAGAAAFSAAGKRASSDGQISTAEMYSVVATMAIAPAALYFAGDVGLIGAAVAFGAAYLSAPVVSSFASGYLGLALTGAVAGVASGMV